VWDNYTNCMASKSFPNAYHAELFEMDSKHAKFYGRYTLGLVIGQALVIGQLDVFLSFFALKSELLMHNIIDIYPTHKID
jgi:hypothetical protein